MADEIIFDAVVTYTVGKSIRRGIPIASGFQPLFCFADVKIAAEYKYPEGETVYPGDSASLSVSVKKAAVEGADFYTGMSFKLYELDKLVGEGTVRSLA